MQVLDLRVRIVLATLFAVLPTCICLYASTVAWWLIAFGGDDDLTVNVDHALLQISQVSGPGAEPIAQVRWPLWLLSGWLLWTLLTFLALSWYERRVAVQQLPTGTDL